MTEPTSTPATPDADRLRTDPTDETPGPGPASTPSPSPGPTVGPTADPEAVPGPTPTPEESPGPAPAPGPALGFPEGAPQSLDPRILKVDLIANWIVTGALLVGGVPLALVTSSRGWRLIMLAVALAIISGLSWWGRRWTHLTFTHTSYVVSPSGCEIRRGVWWRQIVTLPRSRIQHTDVTQGPLQRLYGLATLVLYTAGTQHAQTGLSGVSFETAMAIRQYLLERTDSASSDAAPGDAAPSGTAPVGTAPVSSDAAPDVDVSNALDAAPSGDSRPGAP